VPRYSSRLSFDQIVNAITDRLAAHRAAGRSCVALTESNPTRVGLAADPAELRAALAVDAELYTPDARGLPEARAAIAAHEGLDPDSLLLTASTSEAYALLFKTFCDPGDAVLAPSPSYPLFEHLAGLEGVHLVPYPLLRADGWRIDRSGLDEALADEPHARLIIHVSPGNPTGVYLRRDELAELAARGLPVAVDEVFSAYHFADAPPADAVTCAAREATDGLVFSLGGLSKSAGLPQLKLGWLAAAGRHAREALLRLELVADAYLSVGTPVQRAAPRLLALGASTRAAIRARTRANLAALREALVARPDVSLLPAEAGWSATLRFPATESDEALALAALDRGVLVHPGYFFDFAGGPFLVVSLLPEPEIFRAGIAALLAG
jgi:aspartate/methionine/tyrosine aminotransferase